jgi:hypothetical protein
MAINWTELAQLLSGLSKSNAEAEKLQAEIDAQNNAGATSRYQALVNANRLAGIEQPAANLAQATRGSMLSTFQPVSVSHPRANIPTITGGATITPELRQLASQVTKDALQRQMSGNPIDTSSFPTDAELGLTDNTKGGGWLGKLLGIATPAVGIMSILKPGTAAASAAAGATGAGSSLLPSTPISAPGYGTLPGTTTPTSPGVGFGGGGISTGNSGGPQGLQNMATLYQLGNVGLAPTQYNDAVPEDQDRWMARLNARKQRRG